MEFLCTWQMNINQVENSTWYNQVSVEFALEPGMNSIRNVS